LGFSGGVDSAVSAELLKKQGFQVYGLYMDNTDEAARLAAVTAAEQRGIELKVLDVKAQLEERVCRPFTEAYLRGETPNPCILCNPALKFKSLMEYADAVGAAFVATGHYARSAGGRIYKGRPANDQSYMLCRLTRQQAERALFPLGDYEKAQVRQLAEELGLPAAHKPDSMEICFIPDKDYIGWLSRRAAMPPEGDFVFHGQVVGRHEGIHRYTVGQRRPGLMDGRKVYISRIDPVSNRIELALWEELFQTEVTARDFNWLIEPPRSPICASVRVRHTKWENPPCSAVVEGDRVRIRCVEPVRAPAAGQSAVLYDGEQLLGGGFIVSE
ncbi:MAG: tRNA 2-thiouridine(34) synthase MnmA, partial [Oscillospiraceae bacterium]|nr:tRNA 2-thiouridine(34) synthase MnmA [Oscillospiraceae bacterium]